MHVKIGPGHFLELEPFTYDECRRTLSESATVNQLVIADYFDNLDGIHQPFLSIKSPKCFKILTTVPHGSTAASSNCFLVFLSVTISPKPKILHFLSNKNTQKQEILIETVTVSKLQGKKFRYS